MRYELISGSDDWQGAQDVRNRAADAKASGHELEVLDRDGSWLPVSGFVMRDITEPIAVTRDNVCRRFYSREVFRIVLPDERHEAGRLFTPAPAPMQGQTTLEL